MQFSPQLIEAVLVRRYKRFLADVQLADGSIITVHVANTGSMTGLDTPGLRVWLRDSQNDARKYRYSWELVEVPGEDGQFPPGSSRTSPDSSSTPKVLVSVNTGTANRLVGEAIESGLVDQLRGYDTVRAEVRHGHSRLDFMLTGRAAGVGSDETPRFARVDGQGGGCSETRDGRPGPACYLEVKSVTLSRNGVALFPDSVSARGTKHLEELGRIAASGHRAVVFFCVQRGDTRELRPADDIDPKFGKTLRSVMDSGVEAMAWVTDISLDGIRLSHAMPVSVKG